MRKWYRGILCIVLTMALLLLYTPTLQAQRYVDVPAGYGTLSDIVTADSANRVSFPNTIYKIHRGSADSVYYLTSTLYSVGTPLQIQSFGTGPMPTIIMSTLSDGTPISPIVSAKSNTTIKGAIIDGFNVLGVPIDRAIRIQTNGVTLILDSVQINMTTQSFIRVDNGPAKIFLKNCRFSNAYADWSNARGVDNRGVTIDTLSVVGCTYYRLASRAYRDGGGVLNYGYYNHNTFVDMAGGVLQMGSTKSFEYTNNLMVNGSFLGQFPPANGRIISINGLPSQTAYIANNVFTADSAALYTVYNTKYGTVKFSGWFSDTLNYYISQAGLGATNISSPVTFVKPPQNTTGANRVDSIVKWYWADTIASAVAGWAARIKIDSIKQVNLAYNTNAPAYTWGSDGKPAGSTEWFGISPTAVGTDAGSGIPAQFSLEQNYPNPFNPSTGIRFQVSGVSHVSLKVFDMLGREIVTLVNEQKHPGTYDVRFDAKGLASGVYFYRLQAGDVVQTKKMLLLK